MSRNTDLKIQKERIIHLFETYGLVQLEETSGVLNYWSERLENIDQIDEVAPLEELFEEMRTDVDRLQLLRHRLRQEREQEQSRESEQILSRLLRMLEEMFDRLKRRLWQVRFDRWANVALYNPLHPRHHPKLEQDKTKPKDSARAKTRSLFLEDVKKRTGPEVPEKEFDG